MKYRLKRFINYFRLSNLQTQVKELGGQITLKNIAIILFALFLSTFIASYMLKLELTYCLSIAMFFVCCLPYMIIIKFRSTYEKTRFDDITEYMIQLIYAFHKTGKIRSSIADVHDVSNGEVKVITEKMLNCLDFDTSTSKIFEKTFKIIEDEYRCSRLKILHNFLIECEYSGGENAASLNMLLDDIRSWSERTLTYQQDRKKAVTSVITSIFLAMLTCGMMVNIIPKEYTNQMIEAPLYQIATTICLILCILVYIIVQRMVSKSYLDIELDGESSGYAIRKMKYLHSQKKGGSIKPFIIKFLIMTAIIIIEYLLDIKYAVIPTAIAALIVLLHHSFKRQSAMNVVTKELNKMFPTWIRNLVLYLQTDNTHVAIQKSYTTCPAILKEELKDLIQDLANDPTSLKPYHRFLGMYHIPNLRMSINYLYSVSQFGTNDMLAQLDYLIKQNAQLTINEEKIRNENALAGINLFVFAPMLIAVFKLMIDMVLFLQIFMNLMTMYV